MDIITYVNNLDKQIREGNYSFGDRDRLAYARAYMQGEEGLTKYRDRAIARHISKTYNSDAQLAILFNEHREPEEYAAYQVFRAQCKETVDAKMEALKTELENALNN